MNKDKNRYLDQLSYPFNRTRTVIISNVTTLPVQPYGQHKSDNDKIKTKQTTHVKTRHDNSILFSRCD